MACFDLAPRVLWRLGVESVNAFHLTQHEADNWESARFLAFSCLKVGSASRVNPPSAQSQLMLTVGQFLTKRLTDDDRENSF